MNEKGIWSLPGAQSKLVVCLANKPITIVPRPASQSRSQNTAKYKTDKTDTKKLFDFMPYKDFLKVTRQRFWNNDGLLRNGYFSGLIGTNYFNIERYKNNPL